MGAGVNAYAGPLMSLCLDLVLAVSQLELVESLLAGSGLNAYSSSGVFPAHSAFGKTALPCGKRATVLGVVGGTLRASFERNACVAA